LGGVHKNQQILYTVYGIKQYAGFFAFGGTMSKIQEGELYKIVTVFGKTFELYYGYYDEIERVGKYTEPIPIYPDLIQHPLYTEEGYPFATEMQDACSHFLGRKGEESCFACRHFEKGDELIGVCKCKMRQKESTHST
jgi:hypothetical protein